MSKEFKDVWDYYYTTSMGKEGEQIIVIHATAQAKKLAKLGLNDSAKIKKLWLDVIKQVPFFSDNAVSTDFEIKIEGDSVEATITITQKT
ncbi:MAG: hypothetical protein Q6366_001370 [Candidatus Freyarchaeota archaeon]|nr:hypothetical protein [Candidatus Jordarchaeia archaeon]MBS7267880.1 hypothetical protein [Candidatus Jordarchaeia archaeon]MBS7279043.1 hypothetical protein [Candidatus Jordarchaeia archaeon]